jgi:tetratricopeptide (TPR) repeat protein
VLELDEPQWALNLCHQALVIDPENSHAFYQLACSYAAMNQQEEAIHYLKEAVQRSESYREEILQDSALAGLHEHPGLQKLLYPSKTV